VTDSDRAVIRAERSWAIKAAGLALAIIAGLLGMMWADLGSRLSTLEACVWDFNARIVRLESQASHTSPQAKAASPAVLADLYGE